MQKKHNQDTKDKHIPSDPLELLSKMDLKKKIILEVGTGHGGSLYELLDLIYTDYYLKLKAEGLRKEEILSFLPKIITVDIKPPNIEPVLDEFPEIREIVSVKCADAVSLTFLKNESVDLILCYYTLCAINTINGKFIEALKEFYRILRIDGLLIIEEEFPIAYKSQTFIGDEKEISHEKSLSYELWRLYWRVIKASLLLRDMDLYNEIAPQHLESVAELVGFKSRNYCSSENIFHIDEIFGSLEEKIQYFERRTVIQGQAEDSENPDVFHTSSFSSSWQRYMSSFFGTLKEGIHTLHSELDDQEFFSVSIPYYVLYLTKKP